MKKIFALVLAVVMVFSCFSVSAFCGYSKTYYIDSENGNDSSFGTSESTAWKTVKNIKNLSLNAGDSILFKTDGIYTVDCLTVTCKGEKDNVITIGAYGEGSRPLLTTALNNDVLRLLDCSYITVKDLEITAHNGGGIWVYTKNEASVGVTLDNLKIHDIQNYTVKSRDNLATPHDARACVLVKSLSFPSSSNYPVDDFSCTNCEMYDCGNGLLLWGSFAPGSNSPWDENDDDDVTMIYNQNAYVSGCSFHDMDAEGMIFGMCENSLVTDCSFINCCQGLGTDENGKQLYYTAPVWYWGGYHSTVQNCEVAGAKNHGDGMCCDFDSWTNYCTYQYMYSHDNNTFVCNCPYGTGQKGNTIRYCLSINDNGIRNTLGGGGPEYNFSFYNNTMINCSDIYIQSIKNALVANNIFVSSIGHGWYCDDGSDGGFTGSFTNNCVWGWGDNIYSKNAFDCDPGFVGGDEKNPDSYKLSSESVLLGKGIKIDDGLTVDFYGNELGESRNIGCYGGAGESGKVKSDILDDFIKEISTMLCNIYQKLTDIINKYFN